MNLKILLLNFCLIVFFVSCSSSSKISIIPSQYFYQYKDSSGEYSLRRTVKRHKSKLVTKVELLPLGVTSGELEKTISVSVLGNRQNHSPTLLPEVSQHQVWFEKKRYFSQIKLNRKHRRLDIVLESPEKKWQGTETHKLPSTNLLCFFQQIPECLKRAEMLFTSKKKQVSLFVVWEAYPFYSETYEKLSGTPYTKATWRLEKIDKNGRQYSLNLANQIIFYHFNNQLEFETMFWVAQGITVQKGE